MTNLIFAEKTIPKHRQLRAQRRMRNITQQTKTLSKMSFKELEAAKDALIAGNHHDLVPKYLERMITMCEVTDIKCDLIIDLADLYYKLGELEKAETRFTDFATEYPGHKHIEYVLYKAILCSFHGTLIPERDQKKTAHTVSLADSFIQRKDIFTQYVQDVLNIRTACYKKLIESEVNIFNFYLQGNQLTSAQTRLDNITQDWVEKYPEIESQLAHLKSRLEDKKNKNSTIKLAKNKKSRNKRSAQPILLAQVSTHEQQSDSKKTFTSRF